MQPQGGLFLVFPMQVHPDAHVEIGLYFDVDIHLSFEIGPLALITIIFLKVARVCHADNLRS